MADVLVFGSSHVLKLSKYLDLEFTEFNNNLNLNYAYIDYLGVGGRTAYASYAMRYNMCFKNRDIIILNLGSNDLCNIARTPFQVASRIYELARHLRGQVTKAVIVCQIIRREYTIGKTATSSLASHPSLPTVYNFIRLKGYADNV